MKAKAIMFGLSLSAGLLASAVAGHADAATSQNVSTHGSACKNYNAADALDIDYWSYGVRNLNAAARYVICPIARHPVTGPGQNFYVDGSNRNGASTSCTVYAYNYNGDFLSSYSFTTSLAKYDQLAPLSSVSYWGFVSVVCSLPANGDGVLFGAFAVDS
ncbi:hypothetical protein [Lysobacter sp. ESA13C]|uniref:hypothetical protein n=1 Tax=unclassified Lysobacter TaxID=2635362 RepID=UPI001CBFB40D|nr:hypothetical protein [Lysobacter sp. ESA13C]